MKYNLIFGGIEQTQEYEEVLVNFMRTELDIDDTNNINLQNIHRLSRRNDGKPRNIIARFVNYSDHEGVLKEVPKTLIKTKNHFQSTNSIRPKLEIVVGLYFQTSNICSNRVCERSLYMIKFM